MAFQTLCVGIFALFLGVAMLFAGYRLFLILLPIWGFFAGFFIGASAMTWLLGDDFLGTVTGWGVGFILGLMFALLAYLFYLAGVAIVAGSIGYALGSGLVFLVSDDLTVLAFIVGAIAAIIAAVITLALNLQRWVIIGLTAFGGATALFLSLLLIFNRIDLSHIGTNPVRAVLDDSPFWFILWFGIAGAGFAVQLFTTRDFELVKPENGRSW
jgi:hypothetical protein